MMDDVPRLEGRAHDRVFVDGDPLTDEERDLAAVAIWAHRCGLSFFSKPDDGDYHVEDPHVWVVTGDTPAEAYSRALSAHTPEEPGDE